MQAMSTGNSEYWGRGRTLRWYVMDRKVGKGMWCCGG